MNTTITVEELYMQARTNSVETPVLKDVITYLIRSPGINGKTLAKVLDVKRSALSGAILLLTGVNLNDFLKQWKLLNAMYLLKMTKYTYEEIAILCGFSSYRTLSRFIERMIHCTAYEYREGHSNSHKGTT